MNYEMKVFNFFKTVDGGADYVKDMKLFHLSADMLTCMINQYKVSGYRIIFDDERVISVSKVMNEAEIFSKKLSAMA